MMSHPTLFTHPVHIRHTANQRRCHPSWGVCGLFRKCVYFSTLKLAQLPFLCVSICPASPSSFTFTHSLTHSPPTTNQSINQPLLHQLRIRCKTRPPRNPSPPSSTPKRVTTNAIFPLSSFAPSSPTLYLSTTKFPSSPSPSPPPIVLGPLLYVPFAFARNTTLLTFDAESVPSSYIAQLASDGQVIDKPSQASAK